MSKYTAREIIPKEEWDSIIGLFPEANFLQSWEWGEFQQSLGKKVARIAVFSDQTVVALYSLVKEPAKRGAYISVAGGPLLNWNKTDLISFVLDELKKLARKEHALFVRFRPQQMSDKKIVSQLENHGCVSSPMHLTADLTLQLDLTLDDETLLKNMRKNTRYEIRRAEKLGITTTVSVNTEDIQQFYEIQDQVAKRHHFVPFSFSFLSEQFNAFQKVGAAALISSYLGDQLLAQAFVIFYNGEAVYHYGVSTEENAKLPGSYACQWRSIQEAKARGCIKYNFWGVAPIDQLNHRFAGVSLFKRGFGGDEVAYLPAHDIPVSLRYWVVNMFEKIRKWRRKL